MMQLIVLTKHLHLHDLKVCFCGSALASHTRPARCLFKAEQRERSSYLVVVDGGRVQSAAGASLRRKRK